MNTLGKILVMLVFVMSIFFMAFSFMVFMTQTNWKNKAAEAAADLSDARSNNARLQTEITQLQTQRKAENAARTSAIALLEANLADSETQIESMRQQLTELRAKEQQQGAQVTGSLATLQAERQKVESLREIVKAAQADRDEMFADVVDLKNQVLELEATRQRLAASEAALLDQVSRQQAVLRAFDLDENQDIAGVPPKRDGKVREVDPRSKYVVVTLGSDDGMQKGHQLDVNRGEKYLGRLELIKTEKDRSIGVILDDYRKGAIRSGDDVRTK